jgi:uncharacterized protein YbjT (DUF2867 family)
MILIAGGTGTLGTWIVVRLLIARGLEMRLLTRDPARARHLEDDLLEVGLGMRGARGFCRTGDEWSPNRYLGPSRVQW